MLRSTAVTVGGNNNNVKIDKYFSLVTGAINVVTAINGVTAINVVALDDKRNCANKSIEFKRNSIEFDLFQTPFGNTNFKHISQN
jgi:hypothetical protein